MDLIRLIKLKKINGDLDNLSEQEKYFISLFDGLIKDYDYDYDYYRNYSGFIIFQLYLEKKTLWCSYTFVISKIKKKFNIIEQDVIKLINGTLCKLGIPNFIMDEEQIEFLDNTLNI